MGGWVEGMGGVCRSVVVVSDLSSAYFTQREGGSNTVWHPAVSGYTLGAGLLTSLHGWRNSRSGENPGCGKGRA